MEMAIAAQHNLGILQNKGIPPEESEVNTQYLLKEKKIQLSILLFYSKVLAEAACPQIATLANVPDGVRQRAKEILDDCTVQCLRSLASTSLIIPVQALEAAADLHMSPDEFYCLRLLEETGVCVILDTGFGQLPGTFNFRTTILYPKEEFQYMMDCFRKFHLNFMQQYSG